MAANLHNRSDKSKQLVLFPDRIDRDIAPDAPVRVIDSVIDRLNLDCLSKVYKSRGRRAYNARVMLKVIIYAYMNNVYSCRKIEELLKRDIHFIWLAGYEQPDFITINRFRWPPQGRDRQPVHTVGAAEKKNRRSSIGIPFSFGQRKR